MGRKFQGGRIAEKLPEQPILLKQLTVECDIPQGDIAGVAGVARTSINLTLNKGYIPVTKPLFKKSIEAMLAQHDKAPAWLAERGLTLAAIWLPGADALKGAKPAGSGHRPKPLKPGDPGAVEDKQMRKMKLSKEVLQYFKLFRDPFVEDPRSEKEVFRSADHRYLEYAMHDAATNSGLLAVIAEVGAGKSVMRREVIERLRGDEHVRIVFPLIVDRSRISAASLCEAIIADLSTEKIPRSLEARSRLVRKLLKERLTQGKRVCLLIEESHLLTVGALKLMKVFHELEEGRNKLLGIILLGQPELSDLLDEERYPDLRELSRRIQIATIPGLGEHTWEYLTLKLKLVGGDIERVATREAVDQLVRRLTTLDSAGKKFSQAYPLTVNNYMARAMILAHEMGEPVISVDVVNAI